MPYPVHHLAIDVGNTRSKLVLFQDGVPWRWSRCPAPSQADIDHLLQGIRPSAIVMASVGVPLDDVATDLGSIAPVYVVQASTPLPIGNAYGTPSTLGVDRIANAVGASMRCPGRPVLVIDAGTCITYDLVDASGTFQGGAISPGLAMRALAMHEHSARLPKVGLEGAASLVAANTEEALRSGVLNGVRYEMGGFVRDHAHQYPGLVVMVTGGNGPWVASALKSGIFAVPFLTLEGLYAILLHQLELGRGPAVCRPGPGSAG